MSQIIDKHQKCKEMRSLRKRCESSVYDNVTTKPSRFTLRLAKDVIELECNF